MSANLSEILREYREGQRDLPTYAELADIAARQAANEDIFASMVETLNIMRRLIDSTHGLAMFKRQA